MWLILISVNQIHWKSPGKMSSYITWLLKYSWQEMEGKNRQPEAQYHRRTEWGYVPYSSDNLMCVI